MKIILLISIILQCSTYLNGQIDSITIDFSPSSVYLEPDSDIMDSWYWSEFLGSYEKKSILKDSLTNEAYRLIYIGKFLSIIEIVKRDDKFYIVSDSSSWGISSHFVYRKQDTLSFNKKLEFIHKYCSSYSYYDKEGYSTFEDSTLIDDRDNWVFEFKIGDKYRTWTGIETNKDLELLFVTIMELGDITGYRIFDHNGKCKVY